MSDLETAGNAEGSASGDWNRVARAAATRLAGFGEDPSLDGEERELLVFRLDRTAYALPVEHVREIVRMRPLTRLPRTPAWLLGVVSLRGEVVQVLDLRRRLGVGETRFESSQRIIVLNGDDDRTVGVVADSVSEVDRVKVDRIAPAQGLDPNFVSDIFEQGDEFVSILDLSRTLGDLDV